MPRGSSRVFSSMAAVDESTVTATADTSGAFRWDSTSQQYIYNWKAASQGQTTWTLTATTADGETFSVTIGLR